MKTTISLDKELIEEAMKYSDNKISDKDLINIALEEFINARRNASLKDLKGKIKFRDDYNYKEMRNA
jgi:Arc/MetJ family transcription regulator